MKDVDIELTEILRKCHSKLDCLIMSREILYKFWTFWNFLCLFAFILVVASLYLFVRKFYIILLSLLLLNLIPG